MLPQLVSQYFQENGLKVLKVEIFNVYIILSDYHSCISFISRILLLLLVEMEISWNILYGTKTKKYFPYKYSCKKSKNSAVTITKSPKWYFYKLFCLTNRQNMKSIIF